MLVKLNASAFSCVALALNAGASSSVMLLQEEEAKNLSVISQMKSLGDDCGAYRPIIHYFYGEASSLAKALPIFLKHGSVSYTAKQDGLILQEMATCELNSITRRTLEFRRLAETLQLEYDGWEAALVKQK